MRNLKKFLALVLAMMMVFSMMLTVNAAIPGTSYKDDSSITKYDEAVQVLDALGVFRGTNGNFAPERSITRAEVAAIVYRIITADVNDVLVKQDEGYTSYNDVAEGHWANGYINFVTIGDYMVGSGGGNFAPDRAVTGYEVLATILRAIGYDKNGEFRGANWLTYTSSYARELGITKGITATELQAPANRALVAELLFRVVAKTSMVEWNAVIRDYLPVGAYVGTIPGAVAATTYGTTMGYKVFGLYGGCSDKNDIDDPSKYVVPSNLTDAVKSFTSMSTRFYAFADDKYGEPLAVWYCDEAFGDDGFIYVRFNPDTTYTTGVTSAALYSLGYRAFVNGGYEDGDSTAVTVTPASGGTARYGGNGTVIELFKLDENDNSKQFAVIKNTYVDVVDTAYANANNPLVLANSQLIDYGAAWDGEFVQGTVTLAEPGRGAADHLSGIPAGAVVIYNKYVNSNPADGKLYVDNETIHSATIRTVTVTDTLVDRDDFLNNRLDRPVDPCDSYILSGNTKYEYDHNYTGITAKSVQPGGDLNDPDLQILDHDDLVRNGTEVQNLYFDDYGYVIYANHTSSLDEGYLLVVNGSFGGGSEHNGFWNNYVVYRMDGTRDTVQGGIDKWWYESTAEAQANYTIDDPGLYTYTVDAETGLYALKRTDADLKAWHRGVGVVGNDNTDYVNLRTSGLSVLAGDPNGLNTYAGAVVDSNTVYVIVNYNERTGLISGYTVRTGFKNIPDLTDGHIVYNNTVGATDEIRFEAQYYGTSGTVDFVYITGAKQTTDTRGRAWSAEDVYYFTDITPEEHLDRGYARYFNVIANGRVLDHLDVAWGEQYKQNGPIDHVGLYYSDSEKDGYPCNFASIAEGDINNLDILRHVKSIGVDVLVGDPYGGVTPFATLASNCKIYDLRDGELDEVSADFVNNESLDAFVVAKDAYGFATIVYLIDA